MSRRPDSANEMAVELVMLKHRAGELGLWRTMHAFDAVTKALVVDVEQPIGKKGGGRAQD